MTENEAIAYIHNTKKFGSKLGLDNIRMLMELLGNPQDKLKFVHVAGTNGKGSTTAFIAGILKESGYNVGVFTSPYVQFFNERIVVGDEMISGGDLGEITALVKEKINKMTAKGFPHPTEFEIITAIGFVYFHRCACDIVVLEVGLGGRLDSTNIIARPEATVITTLSIDHVAQLGNDIKKIAYEKAGIIKEGSVVVSYPQTPEVCEVLDKVALEKKAALAYVDFSFIYNTYRDLDRQIFDYKDMKGLSIKLLGEHQPKNCTLAIEALNILREKGFLISDDDIRGGVSQVVWPGRFEILSREPMVVVDGAHNEQGAALLRRNLEEYFPESRLIIIAGVLEDKNYESMMEQIIPLAHKAFAVTIDNPRALDGEVLGEVICQYLENKEAVVVAKNIRAALDMALKEVETGDVVCVFGSLYNVGETREYFGLR